MKNKISILNSFLRMLFSMTAISLGLGIGLNFFIHTKIELFDFYLLYTVIAFFIFLYDYHRILKIIETEESKS